VNDKITFETLNNVIHKLGTSPEELVRKNEDIYKTDFKGKDFSDKEWIQIMVDNPKLIQRPILIDGDKAIIGRPIERVIEFLK
jgi:arsenate reductase